MPPQVWEVVGGAESGGIIVREGKELTSPPLPERLSRCALIEEVAFEDNRLCFTRLTGTGPDRGWVSPQVKDKTIVAKTDKVLESAQEKVRRLVFGFMPEVLAAAKFVEMPPKLPMGRKPRIACLHGTASSSIIMKSQLSHL